MTDRLNGALSAQGDQTLQRTLALGGVIVALVLVDIFTPKVNVPMMYSLPLVLAAGWMDRRSLLWLAGMLAALTFAAFFVKNRIELVSGLETPLQHRLLNRSLATVSMACVTIILFMFERFRERIERMGGEQTARDPNAGVYNEVLAALEQVVAAMVCVVLVAGIALADVVLPGQVNVPILYAIPVYMCVLVRSRRLLWALTPLLLLLTIGGFFFGRAPTVSESMVVWLLTNRTLAAVLLLGLAVAAHVWIGTSKAATARPRSRPPLISPAGQV